MKFSTREMVFSAIRSHTGKSGASLMAIKKYIIEHFMLAIDRRLAGRIRSILRNSVINGTLVRVGGRGRGACGSFRLSRGSAGPAGPAARSSRPASTARKFGPIQEPKSSISSEGGGRDPSEQLPQALMIRILSELDQPSRMKCALVSRAWHELVMQPLVWRRLHLYYDCLARRGITAVSLAVSDFGSGGVRWLHRSEHCSGRLSQAAAADAALSEHCEYYAEGNPLIAAVKGCPRLRCLRVLDCDSLLTPDTHALDDERKLFLSSTVFSDAAACAQPFCKLLASLTSLRLPNFLESSRPVAAAVSENWPNCTNLVCLDVASATESDLLAAISGLPSLQELSERLLAITDQLAASGIPAAVRRSGCRLRSLQLEQCSPLSARGLRALLTAWPGLLSLRLRNCQQLGAEGYLLASGVATLTELELTGPAWPGLRDADLASQPLPSGLKKLLLSSNGWPFGVTGLGLRAGLATCRDLTHLTVDLPCHDELLPALLTQLPRLRCLRLADCSGLTSRAWQGLSNLRIPADSWPDLHELHLHQCRSLTDEALANLCDTPAVRGLRHLELHSSRLLGPVALPMIAEACPWLAVLELKNCRMHAAWLAVMFTRDPHMFGFHRTQIRLSAGDY
uniref:F-box domain-containing protein n=1 Tax=Macrostomum lignano TaxID=282301 RepID=A0A1I8F2G2_9PLAT